jgi:4-hydroxybenzoate polyprenyltransferase
VIRARGVLRLIRPPNVFTAVADSLAGMLVVRSMAPALLGASACLYLAGIVLNDFFDRDVDAEERPGRPIPSGDVSAGFAAALGLGLLVAGVGLAAAVSRQSLAVASAIATAVIAYDGGLKKTTLGPFGMGLCRAGNFLLGLSAVRLPPAWQAYVGPALLGLYVVALTYLARDEVGGNSARRARLGLAALAALAVALAAVLAAIHARWPAWIWFAGLVALQARNWAPLATDASARRTGRAIGGGILLIPVLDATAVAAAGSPVAAIGVAALALPAMLLRRWFSPT